MPITATQLTEEKGGGALVAYLGQRDASAAVCDLRATAAPVATVDASVRRELMDGLLMDRIAPALWRDCVDRLLRSTDEASATALFDAVVRSYDRTLADGSIEHYPTVQARLAAMHILLLNRQRDVAPHREVMTELLTHMTQAITLRQFGAVGLRYSTELIADMELERGMREGQPINGTVLAELFQKGDAATLRHYALRLPDSALRAQAKRRVIRLHIQTSPYAAVRENAAAIEETMMRRGSNPVALAEHRVRRGWVDSGALVERSMRIRQDVRQRTYTLLGYAGDGSGVSVFPRLPLRGTLQLELEGIDRPVTLCAPPLELDPSPCVPASELKVDSPFATLAADGTLRFTEQLGAEEAATLAASARRVVVPITVGGEQFAALDWALEFETPADLVLDADRGDGVGPDLHVRVDRLETGRVSYIVSRGDERYRTFVERDRARDFHVISRGRDGNRGRDGLAGHDGLAGSNGRAASCPSSTGSNGARGEDGESGRDGGDGAAGGRGGNISVEIASGGASEELAALIRETVLSKGGAGGVAGAGGRGGRGGAGGSGGSGTTCFDSDGRMNSLSGGLAGLNGSDGRNGSSGAAGAPGQAGRVTVRIVE